jgi:hypothetical protein
MFSHLNQHIQVYNRNPQSNESGHHFDLLSYDVSVTLICTDLDELIAIYHTGIQSQIVVWLSEHLKRTSLRFNR